MGRAAFTPDFEEVLNIIVFKYFLRLIFIIFVVQETAGNYLSSKKWNFKSILVLAVSIICVIGGSVLLSSQTNSFSNSEVSKNLAAEEKANSVILDVP
jgi:uncharacterized integral membrane protein